MSVNLADYVPQVEAMCSPPGTDLFPDAVASDWVMRLRNGFWDARLDGFLTGYVENVDHNSPGVITPVTAGGIDLDQVSIQIVLFYTQLSATANRLAQLATLFKATAGAVSFETQQSANVLRDTLAILTKRRAQLIEWLSKQGWIPIGYHDAYAERDTGILLHDVPWLR